MKMKITMFIALLALIVSIGGVQAHIPGAPNSTDVVRSDGALNFTWAVNASSNVTNGYNATINSGVTWSNGTNTYYYLSGLAKGASYTVEVWAWNSTGDGNLSLYSGTKTTTVLGGFSSSGAPALTPTAILGGLALWSAIMVLVSRRKKREN